ncbi:hypothetical protein [Streptacidiphilus cavernicola]|uniref:Tetratricopeptide repeat protein n=1 Tax=Streptacidiphilus cavernicola TaxID=3342716 RepID=A0ABV6W564_9ACTN
MATDPAEPAGEPDPAPGLLADYLAGLRHDALVRLLIEAAAEDGQLDQRLRAAAVREGLRAAAADPVALARAVGTALEPVGPLDRTGSSGYAEQVDGAVALLRRALELRRDRAAAVLPLVEDAVERFTEATAAADDPSGALRGTADALAELHLAACDQARPKPEPVALARWLARQHLTRSRGELPRAVDAYRHLLGEPGSAAYGEALTAAWEHPGDGAVGRRALARRMEQWLTLRGDTDGLVAVLATDLGHPSRYLRIAELLAAAGRVPEAVEWAEQGLTPAPDNRVHDAPVVAFLSTHYAATGRHDDAVTLLRDQFLRRPDPAAYRALLDAATQAAETSDGDRRSLERAWALAELRRRAAKSTARSWENPAGPLIEALLDEGGLDAAWSAAVEFDAPHPTLLRLAELRAATAPADAVPVYRRELDQQIEAMTRASYRAAAERLVQLRELYRRLDAPEEFEALRAEVRDTHRAKGTLIADLDAHGL